MPGLNGLVVMKPTSIASTGTGNSSSIGANGKVTFSSCETLSLDGVFTSSYDNYMIVMRDLNTASETWTIRFRVSGTDNSTASSYTYQELSANGTAVGGLRASNNYGIMASSHNAIENGFTVYIFGPQLAQPTAWRSTTVSGRDFARLRDWSGTHNVSTAYDGITFDLISIGSSTGAVTVYGFNQ